jgi:hypothetical protein
LIDGNFPEATKLALQADSLELDANHKMNEITNRLYQGGGGLAPTRENLFELAYSLHQAAAKAAECSLFFIDRHPEIPHPFRQEFKKLAAIAFCGYPEIKKRAITCLRGSWQHEKGCELKTTFGNIGRDLKNLRRDLCRQISEIEGAPWLPVTLDICMMAITNVFDQMMLSAATIVQINLRLWN